MTICCLKNISVRAERRHARAGNALATKLALEVHWTSNLSEFPLRVTFARYALSASAGRRAEPQAADSPSEEEKSKNLCDRHGY
ncbi:hypothetical protein [Gardnerella swidsinskii]|uniref:hypothetical protein n=1 Tax=Gardnerella swidsinskii TaxID=2792979 RepID=UPI0020C628FB